MAITKNDVKREVSRRLAAIPSRPGEPGHNIETVDAELIDCLVDLSGRGDFLQKTTTITTADGTASYAAPTGLLRVLGVRTSLDGVVAPITRDQYADWIAGGASEGDPQYWTEFDGLIYFYPTPSAAGSVYVDHSYRHTSSLTTIDFGDEYKEIIVDGVMARLWGGALAHVPGSAEMSAVAWQRYELGVVRMLGQVRTPVRLCRYNDL